MSKETARAQQLANDHWGYTGQTALVHMPDRNAVYTRDEVMVMCEHHFIAAAVHFYGHALEDERAGMFRPSIGEPLTPAEVDAISRPCSSCMDEVPCGGGLRLHSGGCLHHRPKVADQQHPRKEG